MIQDTSLTIIQDHFYVYHEAIGQTINNLLPTLNIESSNATCDRHRDRSKNGRTFTHEASSLVTLGQNAIHSTKTKSNQVDKLFINLVTLLYQRRFLHHRMTSFEQYIDIPTADLTLDSTRNDNQPTRIIAVHQDEILNGVWITQINKPPRKVTSTEVDPMKKQLHVDSDVSSNQDDQQIMHKTSQQQQQSKLSRFESFGFGVTKEMGRASIVFPEFDDYVLVDFLGEGTFGAAISVHLKSDPSQVITKNKTKKLTMEMILTLLTFFVFFNRNS
ncbi:hypothetical protein BC941DRAFT_128234 [Chlamydoabsidia padenii]|nr:hypothetical protein BC941DRAFT_128234 [Chlamydoabsidia padenii]